MSQSAAVQTTTAGPRLRGGVLTLARGAWLLAAVALLVNFIASIPSYYQALDTLCTGGLGACSADWLPTPDNASALQRLGFTLDNYAAYFIAIDVAVSLVFWGVGLLIFWRKSNEWLGLFVSFVLIIYGSFGISDTLQTTFWAPGQSSLLELFSQLLGLIQWSSLGLFLVTFPTGRFTPRWTWLVALLWLIQQGRARSPLASAMGRKRRLANLKICSSCGRITGMNTTLTAKLKLQPTLDQFRALRATQLAYRAALNYVSAYAFAHRKTSSGKRLQRATYDDIRRQFGLPAQMACNVPRQVGATYKGLWTKAKKHAEARRLGYTKRRFRGLDQAPRYVSPTLAYNLGRDYSLRAGQQVSLLTLAGRIHVSYQGWSRHVALLQEGATIGGAKLWFDRGKQRFYLLISLTIETPDPTSEGYRQVIGVDVGQRYLATVATLNNGAQFYSGKEIRSKADHYARVQKRLQRKGTRSATRRRIALSQRERRLKLNTNHTIAKRILDTHENACIGLEELSGIRDRTKRKHGKKATKRQRRANRHVSKWAFAELHGLLAYKAVLVGSLCIKVDADYTSQTCPRCGYTSRENRLRQGLLFVCQQCGYTLHADLVGARNVALRTLVIRQDWMTTGQLSDAPDVTDREAKAARLCRYAELRWSPATSPLL